MNFLAKLIIFTFSLLLLCMSTRANTYTPVITPNGSTLPYKIENEVKVFHLIAEKIQREFTPGFLVDCWGYNGQTPGPTIEAVEGDRVRILVTNKAPEPTSIHWHGLFVPNGMDGVGGLTQEYIQPGETYSYEFDLVQHGTFMYHPHADEAVQIAMGMEGFFIIHPKNSKPPKVDRDYAIFLHMWQIKPGTSKPNPNAMLDFNYFSFNSRVYPGTSPLVAETGERVRIRFANLSMESHPIHIHGVSFKVTATEGGDIPESAQTPTTTVNVPPGTVKIIEFAPEYPGDWPLHCHKTHHAMNAMEHHIPNMMGVKQRSTEGKIRRLLPGYMAMGERGMHDMQEHASHMPGPRNTPPMMAGDGPFGPISMGGMFTVLKVRKEIEDGVEPGWYDHPKGTVASRIQLGPDSEGISDKPIEDGLRDQSEGEDSVQTSDGEPQSSTNQNKINHSAYTDFKKRQPSADRIEKPYSTFVREEKETLFTRRDEDPSLKTAAAEFSAKPSDSEVKSLTKSKVIVDNFNKKNRNNRLGYSVGIRSEAPSKLVVNVVRDVLNSKPTNVLKIRFRKSDRGGFDGLGGRCEYFTNLKDPFTGAYFDASEFRFLSMWVKGGRGGGNFVVGIVDRAAEKQGYSVKSKPVANYLNTSALGSEWKKVRIPMEDWAVNHAELVSMSIDFGADAFPYSKARGEVYIDDIAFEN